MPGKIVFAFWRLRFVAEAATVEMPLSRLVIEKGLSVRATEAEVKKLAATKKGERKHPTMRGIADGRDEAIPSTIEDAGVLEVLRPLLRGDNS